MVKCDLCDKLITKRAPALLCSKCGKQVHASQACTGLSAKQLSALRNAATLEWTCDDCFQDMPGRKSSFIVPDDDEEEDVESVASLRPNSQHTCSLDVKKLLRDISTEVKKIVRKELEPLENSLDFFGKKIDDFTTLLEEFDIKMKDLEKKNTFLMNQNTHFELKLSVMEQNLRQVEQAALDKKIEITGIPSQENEDVMDISLILANKLKLQHKHVKSVQRLPIKTGQVGVIQVELENKEQAENWIRAAKQNLVTVGDILPNETSDANKRSIIFRRSLTKYYKSLLWNAKQKLQPTYKYVWFQDGKVLIRKNDKEHPIVIRSERDLTHLASDINLKN